MDFLGSLQDEFLDPRAVHLHEPSVPVLLLRPPRVILVPSFLLHPQLPSRPQYSGECYVL